MLKLLKSESGVVPIFEVILLALVLVGAGYATYRVYSAHKAVDARQQPISHRPKLTPTPNPTARWKTYISQAEGLSFQYPADWKLKDTGSPDPLYDGVELDGPEGIEVQWSAALDGLGGSCDVNKDPHLYFHAISPKVGLKGHYGTYVVEMGPKDSTEHVAIDSDRPDGGVAYKVGDIGQCLHYTTFFAKDGERQMWLQGFASTNGLVRPLKASEIETLRSIMLSAKY